MFNYRLTDGDIAHMELSARELPQVFDELRALRDDLVRANDARDKALAVLRQAHHSLTTLHGLWATDKPEAFAEPLRSMLWEIDEAGVLEDIDGALR